MNFGKAIIEELIKNSKLLQDGKDDVNTCKWMEDIEHLLDIAYDSKPSRFDLISYS